LTTSPRSSRSLSSTSSTSVSSAQAVTRSTLTRCLSTSRSVRACPRRKPWQFVRWHADPSDGVPEAPVPAWLADIRSLLCADPHLQEEHDMSGSRGSASFVWRCSFCKVGRRAASQARGCLPLTPVLADPRCSASRRCRSSRSSSRRRCRARQRARRPRTRPPRRRPRRRQFLRARPGRHS
jgi:hypothetical protein